MVLENLNWTQKVLVFGFNEQRTACMRTRRTFGEMSRHDKLNVSQQRDNVDKVISGSLKVHIDIWRAGADVPTQHHHHTLFEKHTHTTHSLVTCTSPTR